MLVHPQPRRRILSYNRLKSVPDCLGNFDIGRAVPDFHYWLHVEPITSIRHGLDGNGNNRSSSPLVKPGMGVGHTSGQPKTFDRNTWFPWFQRQIGQERNMTATF